MESVEAEQAQQDLSQLRALQQQYGFTQYLPIALSTARGMMGMLPADQARQLSGVMSRISRDGRTLTAQDIDAYSIKYTGRGFFSRG
jgi:hypothetical protein